MPEATIRRLQGKSLLCTAGRHEVVADRKVEEGGADSGCTSGELLLLAIGSCAAGSARNRLEALGHSGPDLAVVVSQKPSTITGRKDTISIELSLPSGLPPDDREAVLEAVRGGGVVSRIALGSELEIRIH